LGVRFEESPRRNAACRLLATKGTESACSRVPPFGTVFVTEFTRNKQTQSVKGDAAAETTTNLRIAKEYFSDESYASDGDLAVEIARPIPKHLLNKYDRQPVYAKVWEMPLWQTAEALGVKEDSLSAACVKLFRNYSARS
jgi:hypothetical protein